MSDASSRSPLANRIVVALTPDLGPHTAVQALGLVCNKTGKTERTLGQEDLKVAEEVLGRMLRTLLGRNRSVRVLNWIASGER